MDAKSIKAVEALVKTRVGQLHKVGTTFCCLAVDLTKTEQVVDEDGKKTEQSMLGNVDEVAQVLTRMLTKTFAPRVIPDHIKVKMAAAGKTPAPGPGEMLLMVVTASKTEVHIGINVPDACAALADEDLATLGTIGWQEGALPGRRCLVVNVPSDKPFVERDGVLQACFDLLKRKGVYEDEDDSDDDEAMLNYEFE
jgi:hypothetical protein